MIVAVIVAALLAVAPIESFLFGSSAPNANESSKRNPRPRQQQQLHMALTPVGPFCTFRSQAAEEMTPRMEQIQDTMRNKDFQQEFNKVQMEMSMGINPSPEKLKEIADDMEIALDQFVTTVARLRLSKDFQTREYAKLNQAHLDRWGTSVESIRDMMEWQSGCLRAMADNTMPPPPPASLDIMAMMAENEGFDKDPPPSFGEMEAASNSITADPFDPNCPEFKDSPTVQEEYVKLVQDHSNLIDFGSNYGDFDALGKLAYLDEVDKIEDRWESFYFRFKLLDKLNKEFERQCNNFLACMKMDEEGFRKLLKTAHDLMRKDAERERDLDQ